MTAFAGIVTFGNEPLDSRIEQEIVAAAAGPRRHRVLCLRTPGGIVAQQLPAFDASHRETVPAREQLFAADVRLDNRAELAALCGEPVARESDAALLDRVVQRHADAGIARCLGAFAFVRWNAAERRLLLGRDCLGQRSLFYYRCNGFVAFATTLGALLALPRVPRELDEVALANFLAVNLNARHETFYRGIARVPTRAVVELGPRTMGERIYWTPSFESSRDRDGDRVEEARALFDDAVTTATSGMPRIAIACSGGLDSSAIAATAARLGRAESISCYSVVPPAGTTLDVGPAHYLDESDKLAALGRLHPSLDMHLLAPQAPHAYDDDPSRFFTRAHVPALGPTTLGMHGALYDAVAAARFPALLVGSSGNLGLTWNGAFSLRELLKQGRLRDFAHDLPAVARWNGAGTIRTLLSDVVFPGAPSWARRMGHRLRGREPGSVQRYSALNPAFIAEHDLPRQWRAQDFEPWPLATGWSAARYRAHRLFDANQMGRDLRAASADVLGFEIRDPFADRRLIEFALAVPERLYRRDGVPRAFARDVFADRLPRDILQERRRGAVAPTWFRRLDARRGDIAAEVERLEASPAARRLLDIARLKQLVAHWPESEQAAQASRGAYRAALSRGLHVGRFIRWVEGGNA